MTNFSISPSGDEATSRFPSLASLRVVHSELLKHHREIGNTPKLLSEVEEFICRGRETGALLDTDEDRWASQSLLDYWTAILYRADREPPDATLVEFDPALAPELDQSLCPYLGLEAFKERNHKLFYGRQYLLEKLVAHLRKSRLLAVVGSSGSGKSSMVLGGLIPSLKAGALLSSENWHYFSPMVPGANPLANLARITKAGGVSTEQVQSEVENFQLDPKHLLKVCSELYNKPCLLVVDQLEEMFTLCRDDNVRQAFIDNLINLIQSSGVRHTVILTMRTDFESQVARVAVFKSLFEQAQVRVTAMDASELRDAIEKPAELVGLKFEEGLIDTLLHDVLGEPAALPLLQFTLLKLWDNRERNRVTWETYKRLGGGRQALAHSADEFYEQLIPEEQVTVKRILLRMVRPTEGLEITSNRIQRKILYQTGEASDRVSRVLDKLIQARLVRLTEGDTPDDAQVEVAHEALVRNWPRLVNWLEDERVNIRQRLRLTVAAEEWKARGEDKSALLRGALLEDAQKYEDLSDLEKDFILHSQRAELNNRRLILSSVTGVFLALAGLTIFALYQWRQAENRQVHAEFLVQSFTTENFFASGLELEALLSGLKTGKNLKQRGTTVDADNRIKVIIALQQVVYGLKEHNRLEGDSSPVTSVVFSPDGKTIATGSDDGTVKLWNLSGQLLHTLKGDSGPVTSVVLSPDGKTIATGSKDKTVKLWNLSGQLLHTLKGDSGPVTRVVFSPDGKTIATGSDDKTVKLWNLSGQERNTLIGHSGPVYSVVFSPDGKNIATGSKDDTVKLWNLSGQELYTLKGDNGPVYSVEFSPDGKNIAIGSSDGTVKLLNLLGQEHNTLIGHRGPITSVVFSPDGQTIATGSTDNTVKLWNLSGKELRTLTGHSGEVKSVRFSPDGQTIATGSDDNTVKLWNLSGQELHTLKGDRGPVTGVVFSPDGKNIATGSDDGTVKLWNLSGRELRTLKGHSGSVTSVVFSPDGKNIATGSSDGTVKLWNLSGQVLYTLKGHRGPVTSVVFSPDGQTIATGSSDGTVKLWNLSGQVLYTLKGDSGPVTSVVFSPDGKTIATGNADGTVKLWNLDLDNLLIRGCTWVYDYLKNDPNVKDDDRHLCDDIAKIK